MCSTGTTHTVCSTTWGPYRLCFQELCSLGWQEVEELQDGSSNVRLLPWLPTVGRFQQFGCVQPFLQVVNQLLAYTWCKSLTYSVSLVEAPLSM